MIEINIVPVLVYRAKTQSIEYIQWQSLFKHNLQQIKLTAMEYKQGQFFHTMHSKTTIERIPMEYIQWMFFNTMHSKSTMGRIHTVPAVVSYVITLTINYMT